MLNNARKEYEMDSENITNTIIEAVVSGLISGIFTVIGVLITLGVENARKEKEIKRAEIKNKPRFKLREGKFGTDDIIDLSVFVAPFNVIKKEDGTIIFNYDKKLYNENIICKDFIFENIGKGFAAEFHIVSNNQKHVSIISFPLRKSFMNMHSLNYCVLYDKSSIEVNESLKVKIIYNKELQSTNLFSADFSIYYKDENGNYWEQPLFPETPKLYEPVKSSWKELKNQISVETALECFENPLLWWNARNVPQLFSTYKT